MRYIYSGLLYFLVPFVLFRLLWRSRRNPAYKLRWAERFGYFHIPKAYQNGIWLHAVSVGEVLASAPLVKALSKKYPDTKIIVTTMTPTGSDRVVANLPTSIFHVYTPYDLPGAVKRFLAKAQPRLAIFMETELWPNILNCCNEANIPTLLANARLSVKSKKGYRYLQPMTRKMLNNLTIIAAQAKHDQQNFIELGACVDCVKRVGNMKFDLQISASLKESAEALRLELGINRPVWIAASTHEGEDEQILRAFKRVRSQAPDCLLILVPRHPERFDRVAMLCKKQGYNLVRRSEQKACDNTTDIFIGDTMGELILFYGAADVAFIGGSLVPTGGHNMLEAAAFGLPVITGPHTFNFLETTKLLNKADALITVEDRRELAKAVISLLTDPTKRQEMGGRAEYVIDENRGALQRHLNIIEQLIEKESTLQPQHEFA